MSHIVDPDLRASHCTVYECLRQYCLLTGKSPSKQELANSARLSTVTVYQAEKILKAKGYITGVKDESRTMRPTDLERTLSNAPLDPWAELDEVIYWRLK